MKDSTFVLLAFAWFIVWLGVFVSYQLYVTDAQLTMVKVSLDGQKAQCENVFAHNNYDLEDLVNLERFGSDKNSLQIDGKCFELINDFGAVHKMALKDFWVRKLIVSILWLLIIMLSMSFPIYILSVIDAHSEKRARGRNETEYYDDW